MELDECFSGGVFPPETVTLWWADQARETRSHPPYCRNRLCASRGVDAGVPLHGRIRVTGGYGNRGVGVTGQALR